MEEVSTCISESTFMAESDCIMLSNKEKRHKAILIISLVYSILVQLK